MLKNKILLISGSNPDMAPFISFYTNILTRHGIDYEILYWNRHGRMKSPVSETIIYDRKFSNDYSDYRKLYESYLFFRYCRNHLRKNKYKGLICFTIMPLVFFNRFLKKYYSGNYIFDIRDSSPILKIDFFKKKITDIIRNSYRTVISSEGFKRWLPKDVNYLISHNIDSGLWSNVYDNSKQAFRPIKILTIGYMIRFQPNNLIIDAFGNDGDTKLSFVGDGPMTNPLKQYCLQKGYNNVSFSGRYQKNEELGFYQDASIINILLPHTLNSDTCMSNRFYNSVLMRKPMIVNEGCYQSELVEKYHLGVVIYDYDRIKDTVKEYWENLDWNEYDEGCKLFIEDVKRDMVEFENQVVNFFNSK